MKMSRKPAADRAGNVIHFNLTGLIVFSLALMVGSAFITYKLVARNRPAPADASTVDTADKTRAVHAGPWG